MTWLKVRIVKWLRDALGMQRAELIARYQRINALALVLELTGYSSVFITSLPRSVGGNEVGDFVEPLEGWVAGRICRVPPTLAATMMTDRTHRLSVPHEIDRWQSEQARAREDIERQEDNRLRASQWANGRRADWRSRASRAAA